MVETSTGEPTVQSQEQMKAKKWLASHFMPYVMVFASPTANKKFEANNLSPAEFLRPFGEVGNLGGYTLRTNEKQERVKLQNFKINFVDS